MLDSTLPELLIARHSPRFEVHERLGRGAMGQVFRVYDRQRASLVALKILSTLGPDALFDLKSEFRICADLSHPNLVELHELFTDEERPFFTMELLQSFSLRTHVETMRGRPADVFFERVRAIIGEIAAGLAALHAVGCIHRDVKPSNVGRADDGRIVLLDFGLSLTRESMSQHCGAIGILAGTLPYMSPAQIWGQEPSTSDDWYSLGVVCYELLTGRHPFTGDAAAMLRAKERMDVVPPDKLVDDIPSGLSELTMNLLDPDASKRTQAESFRDLLPSVTNAALVTAPARVPLPERLIGRAAQLDGLKRTMASMDDGRPHIVTVCGASGIGKTTLVRHFLQSLPSDCHLVLHTRCHSREVVSFNAFDGVVDALSEHLRADGAAALNLSPASNSALLYLFPTLGRVPELARAAGHAASVEPQELRRSGFHALRQLLAQLCMKWKIVIWIDDIQWIDADSCTLLRELVLGEDAAPLLWILSHREELGDGGQHPESLVERLELTERHTQVFHLEPLTATESHTLVASLLRNSRVSPERHSWIADIAGGSPFLLRQIVHFLDSRAHLPHDPAEPIDLDRILSERLAELRLPEKILMEIVAVTSYPIARTVALAASQDHRAGRNHVDRLVKLGLLREVADAGQIRLAGYHQSICDQIKALLPAQDKRERHLQIADAMADGGVVDAERLVQHYVAADAGDRAARYVVPAAERAEQALAFARASRLYRLALEVLSDDDQTRLRIRSRLASALANAGRGVESAENFELAAESARMQGDSLEATEYQRHAAEQFIRSGQFEHGFELLRTVLQTVGFHLPTSNRRAFWSIVRRRLYLFARGLGFALHDQAVSDVSARRLDALWAATTSLSMLHHTLADAVGSQHLLEALRLGDRSRLIRALGYEATCQASLGGRYFRRRSNAILETVGELVTDDTSPYDRAWTHLARGTSAWLSTRWSECVRHCEAGETLFRSSCHGVAWEIATSQVYIFSALALGGQLDQLQRRLPAALREAAERDDGYALNSYRLGHHSALWLALDQPQMARTLAREAEQSWQRNVFHMHRYQHVVAMTQVELYEGDAQAANQRIESAWPALGANGFLRVECSRIELWHLRARTALACAQNSRAALANRRQVRHQKKWLACVRQATRQLRSSELASAAPFAEVLHAGLARLRGERARAQQHLRVAARGFDSAGMLLYRQAAFMAAGDEDVVGSAWGPGAADMVRDSKRFAAMLLPGFIPLDDMV